MPRGNPSWASMFHRFLVGFCSQLRPPKPQKSWKFQWFYKYFCKIGLSKLTSIFDPILTPIWLHFGTKNPPKSIPKSIPRGIKKMIDFCIDFYEFLIDFGGQLGAMLATVSSKMGGGLWSAALFFVGYILLFGFGVVLDPSWFSWARFWSVWASILNVFGLHFRGFLVTIWVPSSLGAMWARLGMVLVISMIKP